MQEGIFPHRPAARRGGSSRLAPQPPAQHEEINSSSRCLISSPHRRQILSRCPAYFIFRHTVRYPDDKLSTILSRQPADRCLAFVEFRHNLHPFYFRVPLPYSHPTPARSLLLSLDLRGRVVL